MEELPFGKKKPTMDYIRLDWAREQYCLACGMEPPSDPHHIRSRGSGGGDDWWNVIPLCRRCHSLWHQLGWSKFLDKNWAVKVELRRMGWSWRDGRLRREGD